jgi:hypothetical protein
MDIVADSKDSSQRPSGLSLEKKIGLVARVPCTWAICQELEAWGQQQGVLPVLWGKPSRTTRETSVRGAYEN